MKLHKTHLFLLLIAVLVLSTLGFTVKEYSENKDDSSEEDKKSESALDKVKEGNRVYQIPISQSKYQSLISDLEDVVVPERNNENIIMIMNITRTRTKMILIIAVMEIRENIITMTTEFI